MLTGLEKLNDFELALRINNLSFGLEMALDERRRRDREEVQGLWEKLQNIKCEGKNESDRIN